MGRRDRDERPPIEVVGAEPTISSVQHVSTGGPGGPRRPGVRALVVGAVVVGLLLGGLALGDGDDGDPVADEASAEERTTTTRRRTTTSRPRGTTTTTTIPLGPVFDGHPVPGWLLVGSQSGWTLVDTGTGARSDPDLPFDNPYSARAVEGGVVLVGADRRAEYHDLRVPVDLREPVDLGPADQVLTTPRPDRVWLVRGDQFEGEILAEAMVRLVDLSGDVLRSFSAEGAASFDSFSVTSAGLLFEQGGRVYLVDESGVRGVAVGELLGAAGDGALLFTCDDVARCRVERWSASSRDPVPFPIDGSPEMGLEISGSPDGRFAVTTYGPGPGPPPTRLFDAEGALIGDLGLELAFSGPLAWLPGDAGLVSTLNGEVSWIRGLGDQWVVHQLPALAGLPAEGVLAISR